MGDTNLIIDDTILKMVKNLKPTSTVKKHSSPFQYTPTKRSFGSPISTESSYEEPSSKKYKRDSKLDLSYVGSPREMRRLRADLVEARSIILTLENRINHMHGVRKQTQLMFDEENAALKRQHEYDKKSIEELENQLQTIRKREVVLKAELLEVNNKYDKLKLKTSNQVNELEKTIDELKAENSQIEEEENETVLKLQKKIAELENMLEAAEENAEAQMKLAAELGKQLSADNVIKKDLEMKEQELQKAKLFIKELEYAKENFLEFQEQAKSQANKLAHYSELLKETEQLKEENVRLKEEISNKLILEEEVFDLKTRVSKLKEVEKKYAELQAQDTQNVLHLNEWRSVARGICESTLSDTVLPHLLRSAFERLQQQELTLTTEKVELESQLKTLVHETRVAKSELEKTQKLLAELKSTGNQKQNIIHRMQKKLLLVSRERDSYRQQLDSYEKDLTMCANPTEGGSNEVQTLKERIDSLEKICEDYRDLIARYENDLQNMQPNLFSDTVPVKAEQIARLKDEVQYLKNENEKLRSRRDELEIALESYSMGNDTLRGGQVMHLANNPLSAALAERENHVEKLEKEVDRLKRKIKKMEEGMDNSTMTDITMNPKEVKELKEQIKSYETQTQMLKDYFKSQMLEFRNVIYMLLGYKIDRTQNSLYKLRSMYAEQPDDQLCFQVDKDGDLNLLENEYSATLESMINLHLRHQKSIPVFLSAITMDLFNSKTMTKAFQIE